MTSNAGLQVEIRPWPSVPCWCMGGNDRFGDCFLVMFANRVAHTTGQVMLEAEVESAARVIEHLNVLDPSTDHGTTMEAGLAYIQANGWPPDPMLGIRSWHRIDRADIAASIANGFMIGLAIGLPLNAESTDYDFTDDAVRRGASPVGGHAVYCVSGEPLMFVTWARPQGVSDAWWGAFGIGAYEIDFGELAPATA